MFHLATTRYDATVYNPPAMNCCQCEGIEREFSADEAERMLREYQDEGPNNTTQMLIDAVRQQGVGGLTLLDIGGGVGAIQHALLEAGARSATAVEASTAYARTSEQEAERLELADRITVHHSDFVAMADQIQPHDVVTLDRVICCYHDLDGLLGKAAARANRLVGLVYPRTNLHIRLVSKAANLVLFLARNPFRTYVHSDGIVRGILEGLGMRTVFHENTLLWQVVVWAK